MNFTGTAKPISQEGFNSTLEQLKTGAAEVWTVLLVETSGCGFLPDRRPVILYERHIFHRETKGIHSKAYPAISSPETGGYVGGAGEYVRLEQALQLDPHAALQSTSWGIGQVMGFNYKEAGFGSVEDMVAAMVDSEDSQLKGMAGFLKANKLTTHLTNRDWENFAKSYNGSDYKKNKYDERLNAAFTNFSKGNLPQITVRQAQLLLMFLGWSPGAIDGMMGKKTRDAANQFRQSRGLAVSDGVDAALIAALAGALAANAVGA